MITGKSIKSGSLALLSTALLALSLTGCGSEEAATDADGSVAERVKKVGAVVTNAPAEAPAAAAEAAPAATAETAPAAAEAAPAEAAAATPAAEAAPAATAAAPAAGGAVDGEAVYKKACLACHLSGAANAPKLGDKAAWEPRIAKGMDALMQSAINGIPGTSMLPRGTCATCTDEELKAAIIYMTSQ